MQMVLSKYLAHSGVSSRRKAAELIKQGEVSVNGRMMDDPGYRVNSNDRIQVNTMSIKQEDKVYILLNKPRDYVTTVSDENGRKTVLDLLKGAVRARLYPVGRLDRNTTGLLLLTNDGELAQRLSHPSYEVQKVYQVTLDAELEESHYQKIAQGLDLEDGRIKVDDISFVPGASNIVTIKLHSGKNRIVRRIFEYLGYEVIALDRIRFASLNKKGLVVGRWRELTRREVETLKDDRTSGAYRATADTRAQKQERSSGDSFSGKPDREHNYEPKSQGRRVAREEGSFARIATRDRSSVEGQTAPRKKSHYKPATQARDAVKRYSPKWPKRERVWSEGSGSQGRNPSWRGAIKNEEYDADDTFEHRQSRPRSSAALKEYGLRDNTAPRYRTATSADYGSSSNSWKSGEDKSFESPRARSYTRPSRDIAESYRESSERSSRKEWSPREQFSSRENGSSRYDRSSSQGSRPSRPSWKSTDDQQSGSDRSRTGSSRSSRDYASSRSQSTERSPRKEWSSTREKPARDNRSPRQQRTPRASSSERRERPHRSGGNNRTYSPVRKQGGYRNQPSRSKTADE